MSNFAEEHVHLRLVTLALCSMVNSMQFWIIVPVTPALVQWYLHDFDPRSVGYYSGLYSSAFAVGMLLSRNAWLRCCSLIGHRKSLVVSLVLSAGSMLLFAYSRWLSLSVVVRFLSGAACGSEVVPQKIISKINPSGNSKQLQNEWIIISNSGRLIAPMLGGLLASPSYMRSLFESVISTQLPLLPASFIYAFMCVAVLFMICIVLGFGTLQHGMGDYRQVRLDTEPFDSFDSSHGDDLAFLETPRKSPSPLHKLTEADLEMAGESWEECDADGGLGQVGNSCQISFSRDQVKDSPVIKNVNKSKRRVSFNGKVLVKVIGAEDLALNNLRQVGPFDKPIGQSLSTTSYVSEEKDNRVDISKYASIWNHSGHKHSSLKRKICAKNNSSDPVNIIEDSSSCPYVLSKSSIGSQDINIGDRSQDHETGMPTPLVRYSTGSEFSENDFNSAIFENVSRLLRRNNIMLCCALHGLLSVANSMLIEAIALWLALPTAFGGFGASPAVIGMTYSTSCITLLIAKLRWIDSFAAPSSYKSLLRVGLIVVVSGSVLLSILSLLLLGDRAPFAGAWIISIVFLYMMAGFQVSQAVVKIFTNNSCYSHEKFAVFSMAQACDAVGKVFGPVLASAVFAAGVNSKRRFPFNETVVWNVLLFFGLFSIFLSSWFTRKITRNRREPAVPRYALTMSEQGHGDNYVNNTNSIGLTDFDAGIEMLIRT